MASQIDQISGQFRNEALARNNYQGNKRYDSNHPNALSDGDELGKGENNGKIGSSSDISNRLDSMSRNKYGPDNGYGVENPNAISDGDEYGRGENMGQIGTFTDINQRQEHIKRNTYNE